MIYVRVSTNVSDRYDDVKGDRNGLNMLVHTAGVERSLSPTPAEPEDERGRHKGL